MKKILFTFLYAMCVTFVFAQLSENIKINQVGYYTNGPKLAVVTETSATTFEIQETNGTVVYTGNLGATEYWDMSRENVKTIDFTDFSGEGTFVIYIPGIGYSYEFNVSNTALHEVARKAMRYYYYNRASQTIEEPYAEGYSRAGAHWDTWVEVCEDAYYPNGTANGAHLSSPGGWYDAGDYNKYMQTAGISTYTLLATYEQYPEFVSTFDLNIPESNNTIPDVIDECLYELNWLLTLQDIDGGVFAKVTDQSFTAFSMPNVNEGTGGTRFICRKNTPSTVQFAALMAAAYRILEPLDAQLPAGTRAAYLTAAQNAWVWATNNPNVDAGGCGCSITTGGYGDANPNDEWIWAACEMYLATGDIAYYNARRSNLLGLSYVSVPSWAGGQEVLGVISMLLNQDKLSGTASNDVPTLQGFLAGAADYLLGKFYANPYSVIKNEDWNWGSNGDAGNQSFVILSANAVSPNPEYVKAGLCTMDYILGKNPNSYSMLTGAGDKRCYYTHHRISQSDGIFEPIPGMVLGGPYQSVTNFKQSGFSSGTEEYAMTEVTINWNAPVAYTAVAVQALYENNCENLNLGDDISLCSETLPVTLSAGITEGSFTWYKNGTAIIGESASTLVLSNESDAVGTFIVENTQNNCLTSDEIIISNTMPTPNLGEDRPLTGVLLELDAGIGGNGYIYTWYKDDVIISGETSKTITVSDINTTYKVEVSTAICSATTDEVYISAPPSFSYTSVSVFVDGTKEDLYVNEYNISTLLVGTPVASDLSGTWTGLWDNSYVYLFISVTDQSLYNDSGTDWYFDDCVEVFFDGGNNKNSTYDSDDFQFGFNWGITEFAEGGSNLTTVTGISFNIRETTSGYDLEIQIPWAEMNTTPVLGKTIGFDIGINDDDDGADRENKISWFQTTDDGWSDPSVLGEIVLLDELTDPTVTQSVELNEGWNLISLYINPNNSLTNSVFPNASIIKTTSEYYRNDIPAYMNTLTNIEAGIGYLVYNNVAETISVSGILETRLIATLQAGWNLIGCPYSESTTFESAFDTELDSIQIIKNFDGFWEQGGTMNSLDAMEPGKAYYILK